MKLYTKSLLLLGIASQLFISSAQAKQASHHISSQCSSQKETTDMMIRAEVFAAKLQKVYLAKKRTYENAYNAYKQAPLNDSTKLPEINRLQEEMAKASGTWSHYVQEIITVGRITNQKKYQKACNQYISIADKYGFDLLDPSVKSLTTNDFTTDKTPSASHGQTCSALEANVMAILFTKEVIAKGKSNTKIFKDFSYTSPTLAVQNPQQLCKNIQKASAHLSISYTQLLHEAQATISQSKQHAASRRNTIKQNEKKNTVCSLNDAIALSYKEEDYLKKVGKLSDAKSLQYDAARNASLQNSHLTKTLLQQRREIYALSHDISEAFDTSVKPNISNGRYDLACSNYTSLTKQYDTKIADLLARQKKTLSTFHRNTPASSPSSGDKKSSGTSTNTGDLLDGIAQRKYNDMVSLINNFTPKVRSSFKTYIRTCGSDAHKRQSNMYASVAGTKVKIPNSYAVMAYYKGYYKKSALKSLDDALSIDRLSFADPTIKRYKENLLHFTKLFTEASEYYEMKDYTDDHFKKGDQIHAPLMKAYKEIIQSDSELRSVTETIINRQTLAKIKAYKENNQMMFYYVAKTQYLAKQYVTYASSRQDAMTLDAKKLRQYYDAQRKLYDEFKEYKQKHEQVFDDNSKYKYYLGKVRSYIAVSKEFYLHVKSKKRYSSASEQDFFSHLPPQARAAIAQNKAGSVQKLIKTYNDLIHEYNGLNM